MAVLVSNISVADDYVHGYVRRTTGTYVNPYRRTAPDANVYNNYSSGYVPNPYKPAPVSPMYVQPVHIPTINPYTGMLE